MQGDPKVREHLRVWKCLPSVIGRERGTDSPSRTSAQLELNFWLNKSFHLNCGFVSKIGAAYPGWNHRTQRRRALRENAVVGCQCGFDATAVTSKDTTFFAWVLPYVNPWNELTSKCCGRVRFEVNRKNRGTSITLLWCTLSFFLSFCNCMTVPLY